jgi:DNA-binding transcriptional MerR regulator
VTELRAPAKSPEAFRTISEAADEIGVPQHVLRFWETKFSFIRPMKRAGGRRFYRPQDIQVLRGVRVLLHEEGYTIKGVQRLHKEQGVRRLAEAGSGEREPTSQTGGVVESFPMFSEDAADEGAANPVIDRASLEALREELLEAKFRLDQILQRID